jgi:tetratricopeptide (TPR) repeat protein
MNRHQRRAQAKSHPLSAGRSLRALFDDASRCRQAGRLSEAEDLCRQVLAIDPRHADALRLLGLIAAQVQRHDIATTLLNQAISINGRMAGYHADLGDVLTAQGRVDQATDAYAAAVSIDPFDVETRYKLGIALHDLGRLDDAIEAYEALVRLQPSLAEARASLGAAYHALGRYEAAITEHTAAVALEPDFPEARYNLGLALFAAGRFEAAVEAYDGAVRLRPGYVQAHVDRGLALKGLAKLDEAAAALQTAIRLAPRHAKARTALGDVFHQQGRLDEAVGAYAAAAELDPADAEARFNMGVALYDQRRLDEAIAAYEGAIDADPDHARARYNLAFPYLLRGDLAEGFRRYEWRERTSQSAPLDRGFTQPRWRGEDIAGLTLLVHAEQGFGDTIQFCRYIALAAARGARIVLEAPKPLLRLLSGVEGVDAVAPSGGPLPSFDRHCSLMSLPLILEARFDTIPGPGGYLQVDAQAFDHWRARLGPKQAPRVGLVWSGNPEQANDRRRSIPLARLTPFLPSGLTYVSLQKEVRDADRSALAADDRILDLSGEIEDFTDTAALCGLMDVVLSVCTSGAHLAGALGRPTWIMLASNADWRWFLGRDDSPWYDSARLFRQGADGDWNGVMTRVAKELTALS